MSVTPEVLRPRLAGWDGRYKAALEDVHAQFSDEDGYQGAVFALAQDGDCADAATWLLKHAGANTYAAALVAPAVAAPGWAAKLHVLQMLPSAVEPPAATQLLMLIEQAISSDRPMLRAWGYTGADLLAGWCEKETGAMAALLAHARATETAGSIRARLKRCKH